MAIETTGKSPQKKDVSMEEKVTIDAFKQILLLSGPPEVLAVQGFIPMWQKAAEQAWILADYKAFDGQCYALPMAGPGCSLRSILATIKKEGRHDKRPNHPAIFEDLSEGKLIQALKNFSLIIFTGEDEKSWIRKGADGQKFIALRREQLAPSGRFGRIPLPVLIEQYTRHIFRHGVKLNFQSPEKFDLEIQMMKEHRLKRGEVDDIEAWVSTRRDLHLAKKRGELRAEEIKEAIALFTTKARK